MVSPFQTADTGANVMITFFDDFRQFSEKKWRFP
jgi:hypothetical protein